jgi:hypothetical protein
MESIHAGVIFAWLLAGGLGLTLVVLGVRGLLRGRLTVVNPRSRGATPGILGALERAAYGPKDPNEPLHVEATGGTAIGMAMLYGVLGIAALAVVLLDAWMRVAP